MELVVSCEIEDPVDPNTRVGGSNCPKIYKYEENITIDARCCPNLPILNSWSSSLVIDKVYLVNSDLNLSNGNYKIDGGSLIFDGSAFPDPNGHPGGYVEGPYLYLNPSANLDIKDGFLKGYCEAMWGGVAIGGGNSISIIKSKVSDSYEGIYFYKPISINSSAYEFNFDNVEFKNNFKGIYAEHVSGSQNISNCIFTSQPDLFLNPLNINEPHNSGEYFKSRYAIYTGKDMSLNPGEVSNNVFENHMVGIAVFPVNGIGGIHVNDSEFINNSLAAIYVNGTESMSFSGCSFEVPGSVNTNYQFNTDKTLFCPALLGQCIQPVIYDHFAVGIYVRSMTDTLQLNSCTFNNLYSNIDDIFYLSRPVLAVRSANTYPINVINCEFNNFDEAIRIKGSNPMTIQENIFDNCKMGVNIDNATNNQPPTNGFDLTFTCNQFKQPNYYNFNRYGLFLSNGSQLNPVGGDGTVAPLFVGPNGNGFPADPDNSNGWDSNPFMACFGGNCLGNVGDWQVPQGWYSIWDDNASSNNSSPSFQYYRFENEFIGDLNNQGGTLGVNPNQIVVPTLEIAYMYSPIALDPKATCLNVQSIPFPALPRLVNIENFNDNSISVYPNPTNNTSLKLHSENGNIVGVEILNLSGKLVNKQEFKNLSDSQELILNESMNQGVYILKVFLENKKLAYIKFGIEK